MNHQHILRFVKDACIVLDSPLSPPSGGMRESERDRAAAELECRNGVCSAYVKVFESGDVCVCVLGRECYLIPLIDDKVKRARNRLLEYFAADVQAKYSEFAKKYSNGNEFDHYLLK